MKTFLISFFIFLISAIPSAIQYALPTDSRLFFDGKTYEDFIQGTAGNTPTSGLFGDVRSSGYKFHEGIDIKPVKKDRKGEPLDNVFAVFDGKVMMLNKVAGNSGYGRYIVLEHHQFDIPIYTLYAHLAEIDGNISIGSTVLLGQRLGKMGRSASYPIAKDNAHLHFEIGLRFSNNFERWYVKQKHAMKNFFGNFNGQNLTGFDPLKFFEDMSQGKLDKGFAPYMKTFSTAFVLRYYTRKTPDIVKMYSALSDASTGCGWDIYFTWHGFPHKIESIKDPRAGAREGDFEIVKYNPDELGRKCRRYIFIDSKGMLQKTKDLDELISKIF